MKDRGSNGASSTGKPKAASKSRGAAKRKAAPLDPKQVIEEAANRVAQALDADVLLYNAPLDPPLDMDSISQCRSRRRRKNVLLLIVTNGGDADCAYRLAKGLQLKYERVSIYITGYCKSAGTLVAVGGHELVFGDEGELGPLDVQMYKKDTLWDTQSGLTVNASLTALQDKAFLAYEQFFLETEQKSQGSITVKTAAEIATQLTVGLFAPLYAQIDPLHVGEAARAMQIADHYGRLLMVRSKNIKPDALTHLVTHYPSHGCVIDKEEARTVFKNVRDPSKEEAALALKLGKLALFPQPQPVIRFLSSEAKPNKQPKPRSKRRHSSRGSNGAQANSGTATNRIAAQARA